MLTKAEMEKMWQSGPINVLKDHCKSNKGKKLYKIKITPIQNIEMKEYIKTYEVWSRKSDDAIWDAKNMWYREHYDVNQSSIKVSIVT